MIVHKLLFRSFNNFSSSCGVDASLSQRHFRCSADIDQQGHCLLVNYFQTNPLLKSKLHSPPQADHNWKPINAFPTCLGRQMEVVHSICTQIGPKHQDLCMGSWNITSFMEKNRNWFGRQSSIILVLLESPLPSIMVLIPLSWMKAESFSTQV